MQTTKKSNSRVTSAWDAAGAVLTISVIGAGDIVFDRTNASAANRDYAERHGWNARLIDRAAKSVNTKTGAPASPQDKFDSILELAEYYESGDVPWKMSGAGSTGDGLLLRALMEYRAGTSREKLVEFLGTLDARAKTKLLNSNAILPIANRMRAEAAAGIDTDEMLAGLEESDDADDDQDAGK